MRRVAFAQLALLALAGCAAGGAPPAPAPATPTTSADVRPKTPDAQISLGAGLYSAKCAGCHGDKGEGLAGAPAIAGADALPVAPRPGSHRKKPFTSAVNLEKYISMRMPPNEAGKLPEDQCWALAAYTLKLNGVELHDAPLDASLAPSVPLHPRTP